MPDEENLIVRAARLLMHAASESDRLPTGSGADISIDKRLPMGGGLGGGSSNAATVLVALNHLWGCGLSEDELATLGLQLGADVPVFVRGHAAFAEGVGEILTPSRTRGKMVPGGPPGGQYSDADHFSRSGATTKYPALGQLIRY